MKGKTFVLVLAVIIAAGMAAAQTAAPHADAVDSTEAAAVSPDKIPAGGSAAAGTALLDLFIDHMRAMSQQGTPEAVETHLQQMMAAANKAREAKTVDLVFFSRFNRMLAITKLVATPDSGGILAPFIETVLSDFVRDKLGHSGFREVGGKGPKAINYVATALSEEIIDLQIYLDSLGRRHELQKKIDERMSAPVKK
jgi:hypothetical protein